MLSLLASKHVSVRRAVKRARQEIAEHCNVLLKAQALSFEDQLSEEAALFIVATAFLEDELLNSAKALQRQAIFQCQFNFQISSIDLFSSWSSAVDDQRIKTIINQMKCMLLNDYPRLIEMTIQCKFGPGGIAYGTLGAKPGIQVNAFSRFQSKLNQLCSQFSEDLLSEDIDLFLTKKIIDPLSVNFPNRCLKNILLYSMSLEVPMRHSLRGEPFISDVQALSALLSKARQFTGNVGKSTSSAFTVDFSETLEIAAAIALKKSIGHTIRDHLLMELGI